jgi:outer membrane protein insertion porin family
VTGSERQQERVLLERPRRSRKRLLLLWLLLLVVGLSAVRVKLDGWAREYVVDYLATIARGEVSLGRLELGVLQPNATFSQLELTGIDEGGQYSYRLDVESGSVALGWGGLVRLLQGEFKPVAVQLERPRLELAVLPGTQQLPPDGRPLDVDLQIGQLTVRSGSLIFEDRSIPIDFSAEQLVLDGAWSSDRRALIATLGLTVALVRDPLVKPLKVDVQTGLRLSGNRLELTGLVAEGAAVTLEVDSAIEITAEPVITGTGHVDINLSQLNTLMDPSRENLSGSVSGDFSFEKGTEPFELKGTFQSSRVGIGDMKLQNASSSVQLNGVRLTLSDLRAQGYGGRISGVLETMLDESAMLTTTVVGEDLHSVEIFAYLGVPLPLTGRVDCELTLAGDRTRISSWNADGRFTMRADESATTDIPISGAGWLQLQAGRFELEATGVEIATGFFDVGLSLAVGGSTEPGSLRITGAIDDARAVQLATLQIFNTLNLASTELLASPLEGAGSVRAEIELGGQTGVTLEMDLQAGGWAGKDFDTAVLALTLDDDTVAIEELSIHHTDEQLSASGEILLDPLQVNALKVDAEAVDLEWILDRFGYSLGLSGLLYGTLDVLQSPAGLTGQSELLLSDSRFQGEVFDTVTASLRISAGRIRIEDAEASGSAVVLAATGSYDIAAASGALSVTSSRVALGQLDMIAQHQIPLSGELELSGTVLLQAGSLGGSLRLFGADWSYDEWSIGDIAGEIEFQPAGLMARLKGGLEDGLQATVGLQWSDDWPLQAKIELDEALFELPHATSGNNWARLTGTVDLTGPLDDPTNLAASGRFSEVIVDVGIKQFTSSEPFESSYAHGALSVGPLRLAHRGSEFQTSFRYDVETAEMALATTGALDFGLISLLIPEARASGTVDVDLRVSGPIETPEITGDMQLNRGRIRLLGVSETLEQIDLSVKLTGDRAVLTDFDAIFGGGELTAKGELLLTGDHLGSLKVDLEGTRVQLAMPEGFEAVYEGRLSIMSGTDGPRISGDIELLRGQYDMEFKLSQLLGLGSREYSPESTNDALGGVGLDLNLSAEDNLWVDNDMAQVESRLDLHIGGTVDRPEFTGRLSALEGGKLEFRGVEYEIDSGAVEFVERDGFNPYLSMHATTAVDDYEIALRINGTLDEFDYQLTSNPALSQQDLISLLATGHTIQELTARGGKTGSTFTGDLATNYFAGALTSPIQKQMERVLGLDRFEIDPFLLESEADPTTRITINKEVADDLFIIISTDLGNSERQIYQVEWKASRKLRLSAINNQADVLGGDLFFRERYWLKRPKVEQGVVKVEDSLSPNVKQFAVKVHSLGIEGLSEPGQRTAEQLLPLQPGSEFKRAALFQGVENLREYLVQSGHFMAAVETNVEVRPGTDDLDVMYHIDPGPAFILRFTGIGERGVRRATKVLEDLWTSSLFVDDLYSDSIRALRDHFQAEGYYAVDVSHDLSTEGGVEALLFEIDLGNKVVVGEVELEGAEHLSLERIQRQMLTRPDTLFSRRHVDPRVLKEDIAAIRNLYRDNGFLRVQIADPRVLLNPTGDQARIVLVVDEGEQFEISNITMSTGQPFSNDELLEWSGLVAGQVYAPTMIFQAESAIRAKLDEHGYPDAVVHGRATLDDTQVLIDFELDPGQRKRVGEIVIVGNWLTHDQTIRRELEIEAGDLLSRASLLRSQHRLYQLGVFRSVRMSYSPLDDDAAAQRIEIEVQESKQLGMSVGVGYDTEGKLRGGFSLFNYNFLGRARVLGFSGRASSIFKRVHVVGEERWLFGEKLPLLVDLSWEEHILDDVTIERHSTAVRVDREFGPLWKAYTRYNFQKVRINADHETLASIGLVILRDSRDDPFLTRHGTRLSFETELFLPALLSERSFVKTLLWGSGVYDLGRGMNFVTSVRLGFAEPFDDEPSIPLSERFFAGGSSTLRGFPRNHVGPQNRGQQFIGGSGLLLFNEEFRFTLKGPLRGVCFFDAGNVYPTIEDISLSDLRTDAGVGLRVVTPIGPLRIEYAWKLDPTRNESPGEWIFAIGTTF